MSICKSELLFSPVKETSSSIPCHFSVDSLDCDQLEQDLILTCQANKHNYTIAFEGSITMYSEDSDCQDTSNGNFKLKILHTTIIHYYQTLKVFFLCLEKQDLPKEGKSNSSSDSRERSYSIDKLQKPFHLTRPLESSLAQSDSGLTTWSKMKNRGHTQLRR